MKPKHGVIILAGAQEGTEVVPIQIALTIIKQMNVRRPCAAVVTSLNTNSVPAAEDEKALRAAGEAAKRLSELYWNDMYRETD